MFLPVEFRFSSGPIDSRTTTASTQYLQISSPTLKLDDQLFNQKNERTYDHIKIMSGVCVFSGSMLEDSLSDLKNAGGHSAKSMPSKPTIYEMDWIIRSASATADVASAFMMKLREHNCTLPILINLDVPSFHYYHSVIDKFDSGRCTAGEALNWIDWVGLRHDQIGRVFSSSVQDELARRSVTSDGYEIFVSSRTNSVALSIKQALQSQRSPSLESVLQILDNEEDGLWRSFYSLLPAKDRPRDWKELGFSFYVFEVVKSALSRPGEHFESQTLDGGRDTGFALDDKFSLAGAQKPKPESRRLIISIDEPAERRIYSKAQEVLKRIRSSCTMTDPALVEAYLCRKIFVNGNQQKARLYHQDPTPGDPLISHSLGSDSDVGQPLEPLDVVRRLYGSDYARNMRMACARVGL